jgi:hypothetical protein
VSHFIKKFKLTYLLVGDLICLVRSCNLLTSDKTSCKIKRAIYNLSRNYKTRSTTKSLVFEKKIAILRNWQCCERRNFQKISILNHKFKNEKITNYMNSVS